MKIPGSELALARKGGAERTLIDFIGEIKDEYGTTMQNIRDKVRYQAERRDGGGMREDGRSQYDTGLHAAARRVHHQGAGARRRNGPHRHLHEQVRQCRT